MIKVLGVLELIFDVFHVLKIFYELLISDLGLLVVLGSLSAVLASVFDVVPDEILSFFVFYLEALVVLALHLGDFPVLFL